MGRGSARESGRAAEPRGCHVAAATSRWLWGEPSETQAPVESSRWVVVNSMATSQPCLNRHVGVLGGGQLGRMMAEAASRMGIKMTTLDPLGVASPTGMVCGHAVTGAFSDVGS